jgi:hypothetical protein
MRLRDAAGMPAKQRDLGAEPDWPLQYGYAVRRRA